MGDTAYKLGAAFDTPFRNGLLDAIGKEVNYNRDVIRMTEMLLSDTGLITKVGTEISESFVTTIGTPQGDSYSPLMFNVCFEVSVVFFSCHAFDCFCGETVKIARNRIIVIQYNNVF